MSYCILSVFGLLSLTVNSSSVEGVLCSNEACLKSPPVVVVVNDLQALVEKCIAEIFNNPVRVT